MGAAVPAAQPRGDRPYPLTPFTDLSPRALGSVSRAFVDGQSRTLYAGFNAPGVVAHIGSISLETGGTRHLADIKGPNIYQVTSIAYDPAGTIFYTTDNLEHRDLMALDPRTGRTRLLQKDLRVGDLAFDRADRSLWGVRTLNGLHTIVRIEPPYTEWTQVVTFPYGTVVYDLDVAPDGTLLAGSFGDINGKQNVRVIPVERLRQGDATPMADFDFNGAVPNNFVFSPTAASCTAARTSPASPISSATTSPPGRSTRSPTRTLASSGRFRSAATISSCSATPARVSCRRGSPCARSPTSARSHSLASRRSRSIRS